MLLPVIRSKQGLALYQFSQNAANTPYIECWIVLILLEDVFRGPVPETLPFKWQIVRRRNDQRFLVGTCLAEIDYFQGAIAVDKEVPRFQVSVQYSSRMNVFESFKDLIDKKLDLFIC